MEKNLLLKKKNIDDIGKHEQNNKQNKQSLGCDLGVKKEKKG